MVGQADSSSSQRAEANQIPVNASDLLFPCEQRARKRPRKAPKLPDSDAVDAPGGGGPVRQVAGHRRPMDVVAMTSSSPVNRQSRRRTASEFFDQSPPPLASPQRRYHPMLSRFQPKPDSLPANYPRLREDFPSVPYFEGEVEPPSAFVELPPMDAVEDAGTTSPRHYKYEAQPSIFERYARRHGKELRLNMEGLEEEKRLKYILQARERRDLLIWRGEYDSKRQAQAMEERSWRSLTPSPEPDLAKKNMFAKGFGGA